MVKKARLKQAKIFLVIVMYIQFNFILYMIPSTEFWAFVFLFTVATALFLDHKMVIATGIGLTISLAVSWIVRTDELMPVKNELLIPNMVNRVVCILLSLAFIWLFTWLVERFLVHAKKDEMEKNNERVQNMLRSVAKLSEKLGGAGSALSEISQNESSSAEELAATSENLLTGNNELGKKSDDSIQNLNELQQWEQVVSEQVGRLAMDTQESLGQVSGGIEKIQQNVSEMMEIVNDDSEEIARQNEHFEEVFAGIQEMIEILHTSMRDIATMGDAHDKQSVVIRNTVEINKVIAESIKQENVEFTNINRMVENNANDVEQMTVQIGVLNHMVEEMNRLLSSEE